MEKNNMIKSIRTLSFETAIFMPEAAANMNKRAASRDEEEKEDVL